MIKELELNNYRRFSNLKLKLKDKVLIIGNNSLGKTTILEALSVCSITKSHQTNNLADTISYDKEFNNVKIIDDLNNEYKIIISKKGKAVFKNKKEIKALSEYIGEIPVVFFSPYNTNLIKGSPNSRRNYLNQQISLLNIGYLKELNAYNNLLKERNIALKSEIDLNLIDALTKQMVEKALIIMKYRRDFIELINKYINKIHNRLNEKEKVELVYEPSLSNNPQQDFLDRLSTDIKNKQTEIGIQRDDILFLINEKEANKYASLGQIRSLILSLQITLCLILQKKYNQYPLFLLDDVFGELDASRINNLLNILASLGQVVVSAVNLNGVDADLIKNYQIIDLGV